MSTIKITQLNEKVSLDANTANTILLGVDLPSTSTVKFTLGNLISRIYSATGVDTISNSSFVQANAAFVQANTPSVTANASFVQANAAFIQANTPSVTANASFVQANAAFIQANTPSVTANASFVQANAAFIQANTPSVTANAAFVQANAAFVQANTPSVTANAAFVQANAAFVQANTPSVTANAAFVQANSAFNKANNALANTSGTFGGNLTISGKVDVNGTMILANSNFASTEAALRVSATSTVATPSNDGYMLHISGKEGVTTRIVADSYGTGAYSLYAGRSARGTLSSPSALQANDVIARISSNGYGTTKYQPIGVARIDFVADENFTDANTGSRIEFYNCPHGSNTLNKIASFNGNTVIFSGAVNPQKGFIYSPNVQPTTIVQTIDFARDNLLKIDVNDNATITLQNYVQGKVVELWITNSAGQNKTITHGCLSNNSTTHATTFTIVSSGCAFVRYFSIGTDQANTFCSIVA